MKHRITFVHAAALFAGGVLILFGCNAVLNNEEGTPRAVDGGVTGPAPLAKGPSIGDGGDLDTCDLTKGNKVCFGLCVKTNETNTGCGGSSCVACDPKNVGTTICKGEAQTFGCAYDTCTVGFADCDTNPANGCETSLGTAGACGACGTTCDAGAPLCAKTPGGSTYECVNTCPPQTEACSGACVDTQTSVDNCNGCGKKCERAASTAICKGGQCQYTCAAGTHDCNGRCASDLDTSSCGPLCLACAADPALHLVATCSNATCGTTCDVGFNDCDQDPTNGCETQGPCPVIDPIPCGCGTSGGIQPEVACIPQVCPAVY